MPLEMGRLSSPVGPASRGCGLAAARASSASARLDGDTGWRHRRRNDGLAWKAARTARSPQLDAGADVAEGEGGEAVGARLAAFWVSLVCIGCWKRKFWIV